TSAPLRLANLAALDAEVVASFTRAHSTADVVRILHTEGVPVAPILTTAQVVESPQVEERRLFLDVYDDAGQVRERAVLGSPVKLSALDEAPLTTPPRRGEHTAAVLGELLGLSTDDIKALDASGAIEVAP